MGSSKLDRDLDILSKAASETENLTRVFQSIKATNTPSNLGPHPHPNPLAVLSDACKILKAQTTKLSLLLLNEPFAPIEIAHILSALNNSCLPALATTLDLCLVDRYTRFLWRYIHSCLASIWTELRTLVGSIPKHKQAVEKLVAERTLQSTGVLWATCDKLISIAADGIVALASETVKDKQALLQDAIDEIDEWDPDDDDDDDNEDGEDDEDPEPVIATPTTSEDERIVEGVRDLNLNPVIILKAKALKHMRLVRLLYPALNKHRIKTFPNVTSVTIKADLPQPSKIEMFDDIMKAAQYFTEQADEIAGALYSGDIGEVERRIESLVVGARECAKSSRIGYDGKEDGFSEWAQRWVARSEELSK